MTNTLEIYTEQERQFIKDATALLKMELTEEVSNKGITHYNITVSGNAKQYSMLTLLMNYNYTTYVL